MRRLLTFILVGGAISALAALAYRLLADQQLNHPVADGRYIDPQGSPTLGVEPGDGEPVGA